jgi:hypothetical protein
MAGGLMLKASFMRGAPAIRFKRKAGKEHWTDFLDLMFYLWELGQTGFIKSDCEDISFALGEIPLYDIIETACSCGLATQDETSYEIPELVSLLSAYTKKAANLKQNTHPPRVGAESGTESVSEQYISTCVSTSSSLDPKKEDSKKVNKAPAPVTIEQVDFPHPYDTDECKEALGDWLEYKAGRKESYKNLASIKALFTAAKKGNIHPKLFSLAISHAISRNWQGINYTQELYKLYERGAPPDQENWLEKWKREHPEECQ